MTKQSVPVRSTQRAHPPKPEYTAAATFTKLRGGVAGHVVEGVQVFQAGSTFHVRARTLNTEAPEPGDTLTTAGGRVWRVRSVVRVMNGARFVVETATA